jgi:hypothetical protein
MPILNVFSKNIVIIIFYEDSNATSKAQCLIKVLNKYYFLYKNASELPENKEN